MRVIVGCEYSQIVTMAFREKGHEAYSCDIIPCEGGHPEWHFQDDIFEVLKREKFDMGIFHPPCTHLCVSGSRHFKEKQANGRQQEGINFFLECFYAKIPKVCVENPVGIMSTLLRKPDQTIQPWMFGDTFSKATCLWLRNLRPLLHFGNPTLFNDPITHVDKGEFVVAKSGKRMAKWCADAWGLPPDERAKVRSKTFPGIAKAMANQWGEI